MNRLEIRIRQLVSRIFNPRGSSRALSVLKRYKQDDRRLQLRLEGSNHGHTCNIEALSDEKGIMVLGNLFPVFPQPMRFKNARLQLILEDRGIDIAMPSRFLEPLVGESTDYLVVSIPHGMELRSEKRVWQRGIHKSSMG